MIDFKKVFVDTAPFIYFIEKDSNNPQYYERVKKFFENGYNKDKKFVSSVITIEEYFVFPYRNKEYAYIDMFYRLIEITNMEIIEINQEFPFPAAISATAVPWPVTSMLGTKRKFPSAPSAFKASSICPRLNSTPIP